jgi:hypothetical protein
LASTWGQAWLKCWPASARSRKRLRPTSARRCTCSRRDN